MSEKLRFSTRDFVNVPSAPVRNFIQEKYFNLAIDRLQFSDLKFSELRTSRTEEGELRWADSFSADLNQNIVFYYDHNFWGNPLKFKEDEYLPYKAVISFSAGSLYTDNERIMFGTHYGSFHYDSSGLLRTIVGGSFTYTKFDMNVSEIILQRERGEDWRLYRLTDIPFEGAVLIRGNIVQNNESIKNGQRLNLDETSSLVTEENGNTIFYQETITGHKQKTIEVPSFIDIEKWRTLFDVKDATWLNVLDVYPSTLHLVI